MKKFLPWMLTGLMAAWVASQFRPPPPRDGFEVAGFGRLPVLLNGRIQPFDSVARNSLLQIRHKQSVALEDRRRLSATQWLLEVLMKPAAADQRKVFRVDHPELLALLKLPADEKHFSYRQLEPRFEELDKQVQRIQKVEAQLRTPFERAVLRLHHTLNLYLRLKNSLQLEETTDFVAELEQFRQSLGPGAAALQAREAGQTHDQATLEKLGLFLKKYDWLSRMAYPLVIPPADPEKSREAWNNVGACLLGLMHQPGLKPPPALEAYAAMGDAYRQAKPEAFNRALANYRQWLDTGLAPEAAKGRREFLFNQLQPFYVATVIYVLAFVLAAVSLINLTDWLRRSAFNLVALGWLVHTAGLIFRMVLEGRPPVTNLYSSAVFIGWGAVLAGLVLERFFPLSIGLLVAAAGGVITQIVAHNLALGGDTMEMLRAVLDTNFWLATHVITITLGYSAMYVAGCLAVVYLLLGVLTRNLTPPTAQALGRMVYGVVCFAALFSFVGTVLGGIWADQSWGRFWGWDPKENGALILVLWSAIYLHVRWAGLLKLRGLMNLAIFGNIVTTWSWFGVNMLGVGLHSYGFMESGFPWLMLFIASQLAVMALSAIPPSRWKSPQTESVLPPAVPLSPG